MKLARITSMDHERSYSLQSARKPRTRVMAHVGEPMHAVEI